ncbi:MAG: NAD(P)/FAD-dependent oxidoreductase [Candidatus Brocadiaceae bacterium]
MADIYDFIVVGGGPAGMMAAGRAGERGKKVVLLEKMGQLGRKLLICAKGRCNVTNTAPLHVFIKAYGRGGPFLFAALKAFDNEALRSFLLTYGVETIVESKGRVYPESQKASSILGVFEMYLNDHQVKLQTYCRVSGLRLENNHICGVETNRGYILGRNVLVATGGLSYPVTGSTGDGYTFASSSGHMINPISPAIIAFETEETWVKSLQGTPMKNVNILAYQRNKKIAEGFGEALFTHYGISGPAILDMSKCIVECLSCGPVQLYMDLKPHHTLEELEAVFLSKVKGNGGKAIKTCLTNFIPEKVVRVFLELCSIEPGKKVSQITVPERKKIVKQLKKLHLTVVSHRPIEEAIVMSGGIKLDEVDARTMQSKRACGLYFAGEVLDIDGPTGGFNLQAAFSTGYLAGDSVV